MKIISYRKMPAKYFDICEARGCQKGANHLITIRTKNREGKNMVDQYSLCDKHLSQFKNEAEGIK